MVIAVPRTKFDLQACGARLEFFAPEMEVMSGEEQAVSHFPISDLRIDEAHECTSISAMLWFVVSLSIFCLTPLFFPIRSTLRDPVRCLGRSDSSDRSACRVTMIDQTNDFHASFSHPY